MTDSLLEECVRAAEELGALMKPPAKVEVKLQRAVPPPKRQEDGPSVIAMARVASVPAPHQRLVQAESAGASEREALMFLKASLELKLRFLHSGSSGTRVRPPGLPEAR
ncbi:MAG: hypothetical protein ABW252_11260 [Polyangiales bacterium]